MDEKWDRKQLELKLKESQKQIEILTAKLKVALAPNANKTIEHSEQFWKNIKQHCAKKIGPFGSESIKKMIKAGKMTVNDTDSKLGNKSLLLLAVQFGAYDLVQFLINNVV